jgi:membrane protease YdiL (CAAX protease family)
MVGLVVVFGVLAQVVAWTVVAAGRGTVWTVVGPAIVVAGVAAEIADRPPMGGHLGVWAAVALGLAAGAVLYAATRAFVAIVVERWLPALERHAVAIYREGGARFGVGAALAAGAVVLGEEVFWRGLAYHELAPHVDAPVVAAVATFALYVAVNGASRNLAIVAGAVVGGAVWGALAWATAGVLASVLAHAAWTALMLLRPVVRAAR